MLKVLFALWITAVIAGCASESATEDRYYFLVNADPQMGEQDSENRGIRLLNRLLHDFVDDVNAMSPAPEFVVFDGDLVAFPRAESFANFVRLVKPLTVPVKLVHGNHDGRFPDTKFLDAQEELSGYRALHYSFDQGQWHFVVIPAPEMTPRPAQRRELLKWLADDLSANVDRPTMVFMHYHVMPVGLSQLEYYTLKMSYKRELLDVLATPGNVRYVISGHVHAGVKASIKTAWTYRGIHFVVAPSPVWPRAFGDEYPKVLEAGDGEDRGYFLEVAIDGDQATLYGRKINSDLRRRYPDAFPEFTEDADPRAFSALPEMEATQELVNGDFEDGLDGWLGPLRYRGASPTAYVRQTRANPRSDGKAAYLRVRPKSTAWTLDESDEIYQVIQWSPAERPLVTLDYIAPAEGHSIAGGGYFRITAFNGDARAHAQWFHWGAREELVRHLPQIADYIATGDERGLAQFARRARQADVLSWRIPELGGWRSLQINVADLYEQAGKTGRSWSELGVDRLVIAAGVWSGARPGSGGAMWVDNVSVSPGSDEPTTISGNPINLSERALIAPYGSSYLDRIAN